MKKYLYITIAVLAIMLFFCLKSNIKLRNEPAKIIRDTTTITRIDTFKINKPVYIREVVIDTFYIAVLDTLRINDTLYQPIVKTQKYYTESGKYDAWVSGYRPALDSINVFQKTVKETVTIRVPQKKWGVAAIGGYGVGKNGLSPYVGVGLYYRIW